MVQLACENKVSELKSELKLKIFELERAQIFNEESLNNYKKLAIENEKYQKKIEVFIFKLYFQQKIIKLNYRYFTFLKNIEF